MMVSESPLKHWLKTWLCLAMLCPLLLRGEEGKTPLSKKKILVLCSNGGNGHNAAAGALKQLLSDRYDFRVVYPIEDLQILGVSSGEGLYNMALRHSWTRSVNVVSRYVAPKLFRGYKKKLEALVAEKIAEVNPELVISLIPFINLFASEAARKAGVPYLMITTDNDLQTFVHGLQGISHPHFKIVIAPYHVSGPKMLHQRNIAKEAIAKLGFPLRPEFLEKKDQQALRAHFGIAPKKPIILVMIGGAGGDAAMHYAQKLGKIQMGVHLIVCAGRNQDLEEDLRTLKLHPTNTMTVMGFTDKIADLMAIADLIITKPGTLSMTESLAMRLPILVDGTSPVLSWEEANIEIVQRYGVGSVIEDLANAESLVRTYLYDSELRHEIQKSYSRLPSNRFNESISSLIEEMCSLKGKATETSLCSISQPRKKNANSG